MGRNGENGLYYSSSERREGQQSGYFFFRRVFEGIYFVRSDNIYKVLRSHKDSVTLLTRNTKLLIRSHYTITSIDFLKKKN